MESNWLNSLKLPRNIFNRDEQFEESFLCHAQVKK